MKTNALQMKRVAENFVAAFANAAGHADHVAVYMYILQGHVPKFIKSYGDFLNYGCHGPEHMHSITKRTFNFKTSGQPKKRVQEAMNALQTNIHHDTDLPTPERRKRKAHAAH
jgi:hypothetical protein